MRACAMCHKGSVMGGRRSFLRSHYNPTTKVRKYPNLQWARLPSRPTGQGSLKAAEKRAKICARCLKGLSRS